MVFLLQAIKTMTISKTRYFKIQEIETGTFHMLETQDVRFLQTLQIPGLETRCKTSKLGFHFWVFLPDKINVLKCLSCNNIIAIPNSVFLIRFNKIANCKIKSNEKIHRTNRS